MNPKIEKEKLNFAFWGTPEISSETLDILFADGYAPVVIITSPEQRSGRGMHLTPTPVNVWAHKHNIKCLKPEKVNKEFIEEFKKLNITLSIVVAYGKILPEDIIQVPTLGTINIHYSLLPKYRGASPLEATLLNGDTITGISIQQMAYKLDSGPIIAEKEIQIEINDTKEELRKKLIKLGGETLCEILPEIFDKNINPRNQDEEKATFCKKIKKEDGLINPSGNPIDNYNKYRAFSGWPGIFFFVNQKDKQVRVKITHARYENDSFIIERVIPEGKKETDYKNFLINISK
jgi:methionyl-tRNA formyltransferase